MNETIEQTAERLFNKDNGTTYPAPPFNEAPTPTRDRYIKRARELHEQFERTRKPGCGCVR